MTIKNKTRIFYLPLFFLTFLLSPMAYGLTRVSVDNNTMSRITLSTREYNRILVEGDRIVNLRGPSDSYVTQADNQLGELYIKPTTLTPFTAYITTEKGQSYTLAISSRNTRADTIILMPKNARREKAKKWEEAAPYETTLLQLVATMVNDGKIEGYHYQVIKDDKPQPLGDVAWVKKLAIYQGAHLTGEIYQVSNRSKKAVHLVPTQLYRPGVSAIALSSQVVPTKGMIYVYEVVSHEV